MMRGFLGMTIALEGRGTMPLIQAIHNTGQAHVKAILVPQENYNCAIDQLTGLHQALVARAAQLYHEKVFVDNLEASLTSGHWDTIQSCNSSHYANELLRLYNPQDGEEAPPKSNQKRFRPCVISYAAAVSGYSTNSSTTANTFAGSSSSATPTQQFTSLFAN